MKYDSGTIRSLIALCVWSIFMGIAAISIGLGAVLPQINYITKPFICPTGEFSYSQNVSNPYPGSTYVSAAWTCTDPNSGSERQLGPIQLGLIAGPFYGAVILLLVLRPWYQLTLSSQQKKAVDADWQRKWNAEFGGKGRNN